MEHVFRLPFHRLVELINQYNRHLPVPLSPAMVEIVNPEVWIANAGTTNTRAILRARSGALVNQYFRGSVQIFYNRIPIERVVRGLVIPGSATDYNNSRDVMDALVDRYYLPLVDSDVFAAPVPAGAQFNLITSVNSVGYYGTAMIPFAGGGD